MGFSNRYTSPVTNDTHELIMLKSPSHGRHQIMFVLNGALEIDPPLANKLIQEADTKGFAIVRVGTAEECRDGRDYLKAFGIPFKMRSI